jgi:hypothetical protein
VQQLDRLLAQGSDGVPFATQSRSYLRSGRDGYLVALLSADAEDHRAILAGFATETPQGKMSKNSVGGPHPSLIHSAVKE